MPSVSEERATAPAPRHGRSPAARTKSIAGEGGFQQIQFGRRKTAGFPREGHRELPRVFGKENADARRGAYRGHMVAVQDAAAEERFHPGQEGAGVGMEEAADFPPPVDEGGQIVEARGAALHPLHQGVHRGGQLPAHEVGIFAVESAGGGLEVCQLLRREQEGIRHHVVAEERALRGIVLALHGQAEQDGHLLLRMPGRDHRLHCPGGTAGEVGEQQQLARGRGHLRADRGGFSDAELRHVEAAFPRPHALAMQRADVPCGKLPHLFDHREGPLVELGNG